MEIYNAYVFAVQEVDIGCRAASYGVVHFLPVHKAERELEIHAFSSGKVDAMYKRCVQEKEKGLPSFPGTTCGEAPHRKSKEREVAR